MNLHNIVRSPIRAVAKDLPCQLYRMTGAQTRLENGTTVPVFAKPIEVLGQWQSLKTDEIQLSDRISAESIVRRVYLYADDDPAMRPWAMWRPLGRSGDLILDDKGNYWLIDAVIEDFTHEGWISVQAVLQEVVPVFSVEEEEDDAESDADPNA